MVISLALRRMLRQTTHRSAHGQESAWLASWQARFARLDNHLQSLRRQRAAPSVSQNSESNSP